MKYSSERRESNYYKNTRTRKVFLQLHNFNEEKSGFLILDKATSHLGKDFIDLINSGNQ